MRPLPAAAALPTLALSIMMGCADVPASQTVETRVVLLGTGTPVADPARSGPSVGVVVGDTPYLVDLGAGVVRRAVEASRSGIEGLALERLRTAFITHLHSDHTLGYPDFLLTPWVLGREGPVAVYGPPGLQEMTDRLLAAYAEDRRIRTTGLERLDPSRNVIEVHQVEPDSGGGSVIYRDARVTVTAFPVRHGTWEHALGYRFDTPDRRVVISGDAAPSPVIAEQCDGCDVLLHEVYSTTGLSRRRGSQAYYQAFHTSTRELAELATRARPKLLVLYHQLYVGGASDADLVREIREIYDGRVVSGRDLEAW